MKIQKNNITTPGELRNFGLLVGIAFGLIAVWPLLSDQPTRVWAATVALLLILPALFSPKLLSAPYKIWKTIGAALGWFNTRVILTLLYFGAILPTGLLLKIFGSQPLKLHFDKNADTYREMPENDPEGNLKEQF